MAKLIAIYKQPADKAAFDPYYFDLANFAAAGVDLLMSDTRSV